MNFNEAEAFENNSTNQREDGLNLSKLLSLNRGNNILDIGCATGYLTKVLADQVGPEGKVSQYYTNYCRHRWVVLFSELANAIVTALRAIEVVS